MNREPQVLLAHWDPLVQVERRFDVVLTTDSVRLCISLNKIRII